MLCRHVVQAAQKIATKHGAVLSRRTVLCAHQAHRRLAMARDNKVLTRRLYLGDQRGQIILGIDLGHFSHRRDIA